MGQLFGTDGIRGKANFHPMTPEIIMKLGKAVTKYSLQKDSIHKCRIVIGKDTRLSGYLFETALTSGIVSMGGEVLLVGPLPTPAIAHLTQSLDADLGIVISASHNPAEDNGIKIFKKDGFKLGEEEEEKVEKMIIDDTNIEGVHGYDIGKAFRVNDASGRYVEHAKNSIKNESLRGMKIVLDCANGAAYNSAPLIFRELGAETIVMHNSPNGTNINLKCGSLHPEQLQQTVLENNADLGIAFDGDADRMILSDENGNIVEGDVSLAVCAKDMKEQNSLSNNTVVTTVMSNIGFDYSLKKENIEVVRTAVGDQWVIKGMLDHNSNLGGEQSGHIVFGDYSTAPDAIVSALQVLHIMRKNNEKLSKMAKNAMKKFPQLLLNVPVKEKKPLENFPAIQNAIKEAEQKLEGNGRVFVRYSGTEPLARVMVEGKSQAEIRTIAGKIADTIRAEVGVK